MQKGVNGLDLLEVFFQRRIQPLQARVPPMWGYTRPDDITRMHPEELDEETVEAKIKAVTLVRDNLRGSRQVLPLSAINPPNEVISESHLLFE